MIRYGVFVLCLCLIPGGIIAQDDDDDEKKAAQATADSNMLVLRGDVPPQAYRVENIELKRDAGTVILRSGQIAFLQTVLEKNVAAIFVGEGQLRLEPTTIVDANYLMRLTGAQAADEKFTSALLLFTDTTYEEVIQQAKTMPAEPSLASALKDLKGRALPFDSSAEIVDELTRPAIKGSFRAYMRGGKSNDLRFLVVPSGAVPELSREEVALLDLDGASERRGIWYLSHTQKEWQNRSASSAEDKRIAEAQHYRIDTTIQPNRNLSGSTELKFTALVDGARVLHLDLVPSLRVSQVTGQNGAKLGYFRQRGLHVMMPVPMVKGQTYTIRVEYDGGKVVRNEGSGNFAVGARESWYPNLNSFHDRAAYDLSFKVPKQYTLVSVGKQTKQAKEGDYAVSEWTSEVPLAIAGFNYGDFVRKQVSDSQTKYEFEAYTSKEVPDYLKAPPEELSLRRDAPSGGFGSASPSTLAQQILADGENSIRVYEHYFGPAPYGRIALTQQPQFSFGQSWPTLVYLPISAFFDSTQRWALLGGNAFRFAEFIQEVTPHEVAHQWWGHMVGWSTYHDQWLSEGFADFSAGLFLEATEKPDQVDKFWNRLRDAIIQKNQFGTTPNEAGPLWLGLRLNMPKNPGAYNRVIYSKGAYVVQMLRMMMRDPQTGDKDFMDLMHDFVQTNLHKNATTEGFKSIVEKHMKPNMDAEGNQRIDWFFRDWVYGTDLPAYRMEYSLAPSSGGKVLFTGKLSQSGVPTDFRMRVPLYFDFDGKVGRAGAATLIGSSSIEIKVELPKKPKRVLLNANHDVLATDITVKEL